MPKRRPPAYLHHKARDLGYCRIDGRQVYFPVRYNSAESRAAYDAKFADWLRAADREKFPLLIADVCAQYSDLLRRGSLPGRVLEAIEAVGASVRYLPPYSPDLNPIELAFSKFKKLLPDGAKRTTDKLWSLCGRVLDLFSASECGTDLNLCGYRCT